jgi:phosphoribosyl 1,2-cyclic phosphodiesterase
MAVHFHVLASGSSGNCSLLEVGGFGILIDLGLGPRQLAGRLGDCPPLWERIHVALLTHLHGDHWNENTLKRLLQRRIPLYCHPEHTTDLHQWSHAARALAETGLLRSYAVGQAFDLAERCRCEPFRLRHDGGMTCGFRFEGPSDVFGGCWALGYAADLGSWDRALAELLADVDVLALEFNHDVALQYASGRSPRLIRRVLGDHGHLSNSQAASLLAEVLRQSEPGRIQHLVQLHLSRQCNRPELAREAAQVTLQQSAAAVQVHTTSQEHAGPSIAIDGVNGSRQRRRIAPRKPAYPLPSLFPDWE